jgi:hypothetical protein
MMIVDKYCEQILETHIISDSAQPNEIGCRVRLSAYGIEMQGKRKAKLIGTVVDWINWCSTPTFKDGLSTVKWDGKSKPETMHCSQLETIKQ